MPVLSYKTKDGKRVKDSLKIYFCSTPKDFDIYFERISNEIWKVKNSVIYYDENPEEEKFDDIWKGKLASMNMYVAVITEDFMKNDKAKAEFRFAKEKKISIVPVFAEYGIEKVFNEEFHNIQGVTLYNIAERDEERREKEERLKEPFYIQLKKIMDKIAMDDELYERIRNEAYVYIFISYRKKDFLQANDYMKCIHNIEGCDDIAFWFDDYLVPGEDFEEAIREKLEKSNAVGLVVTPNLIALNDDNMDNYVVKIEYPMAKTAMKDILPLEMEKTNYGELQEKLPGLDALYSTDDVSDISNFVKKIMREENKDSQEHEFLIGMAYLRGIDREINVEKAEKKIQKAAEMMYLEAMKQLVHMYRNGDGVETSPEKQIKWQKSIVDMLIKKYGKANSDKKNRKKEREQMLPELSEQILLLGNFYEENGEIAKAIETYEIGMDYCRYADKYVDSVGRNYIEMTYLYISVKMKEASTNEEAKKLIYKCKEVQNKVLKMFAKNQSGIEFRMLYLLRALEADLHRLCNESKQAILLYEITYNALKHIKTHDDFDIYYGDLNHLLEKKGETLISIGQIEEGIATYEEAINLSSQWMRESESDDANNSLSIVYEKMGDMYRDEIEGGLEKAEKYILKSVEISKQFVEDPSKNTIGRQLDLAGGYRRLGDIYERKKQWDKAIEYYQRALDLHKFIYEKYKNNNEFVLRYAENFIDFADVYFVNWKEAYEEGWDKEEEEYYKLTEEYYRNGYEIAGSVPLTMLNAYRRQHIISRYYYRMATLYINRMQDVEKGKEFFNNALKEVRVDALKEEAEFRKTEMEILNVLKNL